MSVTTTAVTKGEQVLDDLRDHLIFYLEQPGSMSLRALARKCGVSPIPILKFRDGETSPRFELAVQMAESIGFDLSKSLKTVGSSS